MYGLYNFQINKLILPHLLCVGGIISLPSKKLKNNLSKNKWLHGVIFILHVRESIFIGWGSPFPILLVPKYKLFLCHTPVKPDLLGFSRNLMSLRVGCLTACSRGSYHLVLKPNSINKVISCWNFCFLLISQKILSVQFLRLIEFAAYQKIKKIISLCYYPKYISSIKKREKRKERKKSFKKTFIGFCHRKLNKEKLDQINSEWAQIPHINFGVNWISFALVFNFGSNQVWFINIFALAYQPYCKLLKFYILSIGVAITLYFGHHLLNLTSFTLGSRFRLNSS